MTYKQEIGHFESCDSLANRDGYAATYLDGTSYSDPKVYQTCDGGLEGSHATGEGPCSPDGTVCLNATTQGPSGPVACPTGDATSGALCEFADGYCFPGGSRPVTLDGAPTAETARLTGCFQDQFQNGDLDFDGNPYQPFSWPNGTARTPTVMRYTGPYSHGQPYPQVQFETDVGGSSALCNTATGAGCTAPPIGARFYPYWTLSNPQRSDGQSGQSEGRSGGCLWNLAPISGRSRPITSAAMPSTARLMWPAMAEHSSAPSRPTRRRRAPAAHTGGTNLNQI